MKVYISADIEGVAGISHWDEASKARAEYAEYRQMMTAEVVAACSGALEAGATEILIKDAHGSGRNIIAAELPPQARLIRGWSGSPLGMVQELDESFDALAMIGYHSKAGTESNPLAHTLTLDVHQLTINGMLASEFLIHAYAAAMFNVPVVFVSGDRGLVDDIASINSHISAQAVSEGIGESTISITPALARRKIQNGLRDALVGDLANCIVALPDSFEVEVFYRRPTSAYRTAHYPGASRSGPRAIRFSTSDYFEVLRFILFTVLGRT